MVYWSRSRQELWRKGATSGDTQTVREAFYDCDGDTLLFKVTQHGRGACHTGARTLLLHAGSTPRRHRPVTDLRGRGRNDPRPSRAEFHSLAATYTIVPVSTELLADLETPVAAFAKLVGDGDGFLLESVEHGERWGRFSFVGWDPVMTLTLRDGVVAVDGPAPVSVPTDRGILAAIEAVLRGVPGTGARRSSSAVGRLDRLSRLRRHPRGRTPARTCRPTTVGSRTRR